LNEAYPRARAWKQQKDEKNTAHAQFLGVHHYKSTYLEGYWELYEEEHIRQQVLWRKQQKELTENEQQNKQEADQQDPSVRYLLPQETEELINILENGCVEEDNTLDNDQIPQTSKADYKGKDYYKGLRYLDPENTTITKEDRTKIFHKLVATNILVYLLRKDFLQFTQVEA
jgi:hypothetical protein